MYITNLFKVLPRKIFCSNYIRTNLLLLPTIVKKKENNGSIILVINKLSDK